MRVPFLMQIPRLKLPGKSRVGTSLLARVASESGFARFANTGGGHARAAMCVWKSISISGKQVKRAGFSSAFPPKRSVRADYDIRRRKI